MAGEAGRARPGEGLRVITRRRAIAGAVTAAALAVGTVTAVPRVPWSAAPGAGALLALVRQAMVPVHAPPGGAAPPGR